MPLLFFELQKVALTRLVCLVEGDCGSPHRLQSSD